ncbi:MAG: hypothetical protein ACRERU_05930 [Methylococcales bacterium]
MKRLSFIEGLLIALIASVCGGSLFFSLAPWFTVAWLLKLIGSLIAGGYVVYLLIRAPRPTGRITALTVWVLLATAGWLLVHSVLVFIALHLIGIWLIRSLYFYNGPSAALVDLVLCGLSLAAAAWVSTHTGSVALGIWCLFLIQALVSMVPSDFKQTSQAWTDSRIESDRFERACRSAESALRKLS